MLWLCSLLSAHAATYTVDNEGDSGAGTLREALELANLDSGLDTIDFDLSGGPLRIELDSPLPPITGTVIIDGTAGGSNCKTLGTPHELEVTVFPSGAYPSDVAMLEVRPGAQLDLSGLAFTEYTGAAVRIVGEVLRSTVRCSWFGVSADGVPSSTRAGTGVQLALSTAGLVPSHISIGAEQPGDGTMHNLFVASERGIHLADNSNATGAAGGDAVLIAGNLFGTDPAGEPVAPNDEDDWALDDGILVRVPFPQLQVGAACDGAKNGLGNVYGVVQDRMIDLQVDAGLDRVCIGGNDFHRSLTGLPFGGDFRVGILLQGDHDDVEIAGNRFARLSTAIVARSRVVYLDPGTNTQVDTNAGVFAGELGEGLQIRGNTFGEEGDGAMGVQRAMSLQLLGGARVDDNLFYGGLDDSSAGVSHVAGAGALITGADVAINGNTFTDVPADAVVRIRPFDGDPAVDARDDDVLSVVTAEENTFMGVRLPYSVSDQPRSRDLGTLDDHDSSPSGVALAHQWRVLPAVASPFTPVAWDYRSDVAAHTAVVAAPAVLTRVLPGEGSLVGTYLGTTSADRAGDLSTWPEMLLSVIDTDDVPHDIDLSACDVTYTSAASDADWTQTNGVLGTVEKGDFERYRVFDLTSEDCACGNGFVDEGEACDDGNDVDGDGCSGCSVDAGFVCSELPLTTTGQSAGGQVLPHGHEADPWGIVGGGAPATLHDPLHCDDPLTWTSGELVGAKWLVGSDGIDECSKFPAEGSTLYAHGLDLEPRHRVAGKLPLWVAVDNVLAEVERAGLVVTTYDPPVTNYASLRKIHLPTDALSIGPGELVLPVENTGGAGGLMVVPAASACGPDHDLDGVADFGDADSDDDGIADAQEGGQVDPSGDLDTDGVPNYADPDTEGFVDADANGVDDRVDPDGDGLPNHLDLDSDGDGLFDADEAGWPATDGVVDGPDTDGDGTRDAVEEPAAVTDPFEQAVAPRVFDSDPYDASDPPVVTTGHTGDTDTGRPVTGETGDTGVVVPTGLTGLGPSDTGPGGEGPTTPSTNRAPGFACQTGPSPGPVALLAGWLLLLGRRRLAR